MKMTTVLDLVAQPGMPALKYGGKRIRSSKRVSATYLAQGQPGLNEILFPKKIPQNKVITI